MALSNVSIPALKAPTFKVLNLKAPVIKPIKVAKISAKITAKPVRPGSLKITGTGFPKN